MFRFLFTHARKIVGLVHLFPVPDHPLYDENMNERPARRLSSKKVLLVVLTAAIVVLLAMVAMLVLPILTHKSAGGSGQHLPTGYVASAKAEGADGRTRELQVLSPNGSPADLSKLVKDEDLVVRGTGFDARIGIYVSICAIPDKPGQKPSPCLGGLPEGAMEGEAAGSETPISSAWITNDWAWRAFANKGYDDAKSGAFEVTLRVPAGAQEGLDCAIQRCAITTRADHTAATDRVQDMQLPVAFADEK